MLAEDIIESAIAFKSDTELCCIRKIIEADPREYGHLSSDTERAVEAILGIERKEKTA